MYAKQPNVFGVELITINKRRHQINNLDKNNQKK